MKPYWSYRDEELGPILFQIMRVKKKTIQNYARIIGMSEQRLTRLLGGRVKTVTDDDVKLIASEIDLSREKVRAALEEVARTGLV